MLDQLMGAERNVRLEERTGKTKQFSDPDVCKYFLCGICPHDLFKGTKSDLGVCATPCTDEGCKRSWDALSQAEKDELAKEAAKLEKEADKATAAEAKAMQETAAVMATANPGNGGYGGNGDGNGNGNGGYAIGGGTGNGTGRAVDAGTSVAAASPNST